MNILTICYEYPPLGGGGAPVCEGLCESLVKLGHNVDVVTSMHKNLAANEHRKGVRIFRTRCIRRHSHYTTTAEMATGLYPAYRKALELSQTNKYDLLHCHFIVPSGLVSSALSRKTGIPYLITVHGSDVPGYNPDRFSLAHKMIKPVWRYVIGGCKTSVTPSSYLESLLKNSAANARTDIIPNGWTIPRERSSLKRNRILMVSRMFKRKGVDILIDAVASIDSKWELVIAGDGPYLQTAIERAQKKKISATFLGHVNKKDLPELYRSAKIFAFPSIRENFPVVLLEAMAEGCAIVTTKGSGCSEVVGDAALLVQPGNLIELRSAITRLIDNETLMEDLGRRSYKQSLKFSWTTIAKRYESLYHRILDPQSA